VKAETHQKVHDNLAAIIVLATQLGRVGRSFANVGMNDTAEEISKFAHAFGTIARDTNRLIKEDTFKASDEYFGNVFNTLNGIADILNKQTNDLLDPVSKEERIRKAAAELRELFPLP
jgi:hypothetical protein